MRIVTRNTENIFTIIDIQTSPDEALEDIIEKYPEPYRNSTEVANVIK